MPVIDEDKLQRLTEVPYPELRQLFRQQLEAAQGQVSSLARQYPKLVSGQAVGGAALVLMLRKLVENINNNKALNIQTAWDGVQHNACASIMESLKEARVAELRKIT